MGTKFIHSTCGQSMIFTVTEDRGPLKTPQAAKIVKEITVKGGAWVITPEGRVPKVVITEVSDEDLEFLERDECFQRQKQAGFITVRDYDHIKEDSRGLPTDHEKKDGTSQILDEDHAKGTDERVGHDGTRATYGEQNQFGGLQPASVDTSDYGPIRVA